MTRKCYSLTMDLESKQDYKELKNCSMEKASGSDKDGGLLSTPALPKWVTWGSQKEMTNNYEILPRDIGVSGIYRISGIQVVFSSFFLARDWDTRRIRWKDHFSDWLHEWYHVQGYGFYGSGHIFKRLGRLTLDGMQLLGWDNNNLTGRKLAGLTEL